MRAQNTVSSSLLFAQIYFRERFYCAVESECYCTINRTHVMEPFTWVLQTYLSIVLFFFCLLFVLVTIAHNTGPAQALST